MKGSSPNWLDWVQGLGYSILSVCVKLACISLPFEKSKDPMMHHMPYGMT